MPNTATGLLSSIGTAEESTYGTGVTVDRFYEFLTETLERENKILQSNGLRSGTINLRRGSRRVISAHSGKGAISMEVPTTGFGRWLKHALGGTPTIAQQGATPAYLQTHALGSNSGKFLTVQKVLRDSANNVIQAFTFLGCKILSIEFSIGVDTELLCSIEIDARDVDTATAAAMPSYVNNKPFNFTQGAITVGGVAVAKVTDASVKLTRPQKTDGFYLGSAGLKSEPVENNYPTIEGKLTAEFDSAAKTAYYDRFAADSAVALVLQFTGAVISGIYNESFAISIPEIHFTGETPKVGGPELVMVNAPFEGAYDGTNSGMVVLYTSTDTTIV